MLNIRVLLKAASHECSNKDCPKGSKHFFMAGNHWTEAFDLNLDAIFNLETWSRDKIQHDSENSRVAKRRKCRVAKSTKRGVAKCDAIQGENHNHVSLGVDDSSALTSGSKKASKQVSLATTSLASP